MSIYMVRSINIITRIGSKQNDIKFFKHLLPLNVATVVEPFAGSFAVIKNFYTDINKYKFHINDLDKVLYYAYEHFEDLINIVKEIRGIYYELCAENPKYIKELSFKPYVDKLDINEHLKHYIIDSYFIRGNICRIPKGSNYNEEEKEILKHALITNDDFKQVMEKYHDDVDAFMFLDPPYLFSNNSTYIPQNVETDMTNIVVYICEFLKTCKCKVMLIINKLSLLEYLFKDYIKGEYLRIYQMGKKKSYHLIITNY